MTRSGTSWSGDCDIHSPSRRHKFVNLHTQIRCVYAVASILKILRAEALFSMPRLSNVRQTDMKTISKWIVTGCLELVFCFWLLGTAANLVSSPSNAKVGLGVFCYFTGLLAIPGASAGYVIARVADARARQKQLQQAFPDDEIAGKTTVLKLLDSKRSCR